MQVLSRRAPPCAPRSSLLSLGHVYSVKRFLNFLCKAISEPSVAQVPSSQQHVRHTVEGRAAPISASRKLRLRKDNLEWNNQGVTNQEGTFLIVTERGFSQPSEGACMATRRADKARRVVALRVLCGEPVC